MKKTEATMQHWFSNAYIKFFKDAKKNRKKLMQQRNTDFHTSIFCHQKKLSFLLIQESYLVQRCHTYLETHLFNFEKKRWKKLTQPCNTDFRTHIPNFLKKQKKQKKTDATTQHWFSHISILPLLNFEKKRWKKLKQPRNTDFRTHI